MASLDDINGTFVVPGQYISPTYKSKDSKIIKYESGRGTSISHIEVSSKTIAVVVSTILGKVYITQSEEVIRDTEEVQEEGNEVGSDMGGKYIIHVIPKDNIYDKFNKEIENFEASNLQIKSSINLPKENDIVLAKVLKLNLKQAFVEILSVENQGNILVDSGIGSNGDGEISSGGGSQALQSIGAVASSGNGNTMTSDLGESFKGVIRLQDIRSLEKDKCKIIDCFKPGDIVRCLVISLGDGSNYYLSTARNDLGVILAKSNGGTGELMYAIDWKTMICPKSGIIENRKCAKLF